MFWDESKGEDTGVGVPRTMDCCESSWEAIVNGGG